MTASGRRWLVWSAALVSVSALGCGLGLVIAADGSVWWILPGVVPLLGCLCMGGLLIVRVPANPLGWMFLGIGVVLPVGRMCDAYVSPALALPGRDVAAVAANLLLTVPLMMLPAVLLLFPEGRLPSRRWRPIARAWIGAAVVFKLLQMAAPGPMGLDSAPRMQNPIAIATRIWSVLAYVEIVSLIVILVLPAVAAASLILRFRRARGDLRQQLKLFGAAATGVGAVAVMSPVLWSLSPPWSTIVVVVLWSVAATGLVMAIGVAILRYRLYEIDVIIRRTIVYTALIGSLALVYLCGIYVIGRAMQAVTGQSDALAVTLSTLAVAAVFQPLRARIAGSVDRRFYRQKYDTQQTLDSFTVRLRNQIELDALSADVLAVVTATLQPDHADLWLRPATSRESVQAGS